jgi:hypothetical protein
MPIMTDIVLESVLKSTIKHQLPYFMGGPINGATVAYYQGLFCSLIVNGVAWFAISTAVNKYYWKYTGFKDEMYLVSEYVIHRKKKEPANVRIGKSGNRKEGNDGKTVSASKNTGDERIDNLGRPIKS